MEGGGCATFHSLPLCYLRMYNQARIDTGFRRFTELCQIFKTLNFPSWNLESGLDSQQISCLNESQTQERGFRGVKIQKNFPKEHMPSDLPRSRKSISIYSSPHLTIYVPTYLKIARQWKSTLTLPNEAASIHHGWLSPWIIVTCNQAVFFFKGGRGERKKKLFPWET